MWPHQISLGVVVSGCLCFGHTVDKSRKSKQRHNQVLFLQTRQLFFIQKMTFKSTGCSFFSRGYAQFNSLGTWTRTAIYERSHRRGGARWAHAAHPPHHQFVPCPVQPHKGTAPIKTCVIYSPWCWWKVWWWRFLNSCRRTH